ncbi:MAG: thiamine pyrophosphate-dependent enzyme [Acidobacteriota bacterium]
MQHSAQHDTRISDRHQRDLFHPPELQVETTVSAALTRHLHDLGVERAFGVIGGSIGVFFDALEESLIEVQHTRHETGAAFAATEAYFAASKPTVVYATTGPGLLNVLTGIAAAKWDGAKVILISGATSAPQRGRWATQETSSYTMPQDVFYGHGPIFDYAVRIEHPAEITEAMRRLALGLSRPGGFVAHICLPIGVQAQRVELPRIRATASVAAPTAAREDIEHTVELLKSSPFVVWAGFGARKAARQIRELVERTGSRIMVSPRGKGIIPEDHPLYLGVTGLGGHEGPTEHMLQHQPDWILVLGTRLGEATSFWDRDLEPTKGFIHVDLDPCVPGTAYPHVRTVGVHAEIGTFLDSLIPHFPEGEVASVVNVASRMPSTVESLTPLTEGPVRPQVLMNAIQRRIVAGSDAMVMSECGNSFAWCNHHLRFAQPERYRVSTLYGSMGHTCAGVVGAALARGGKAVAVVGDGAMLMNSEISTAVQYHAPAVWIVLNDAGYGMCESGQQVLGLACNQLEIPRVDFVGLARSLGADGILVETEDMLDVALEKAMDARAPFVVDVRIDKNEPSPLMQRFESLLKQGSSKHVAGWEI